jgi:hypothetical protein
LHKRITVIKQGYYFIGYGMSGATYYSWKAKYSGMATSDLKLFKAPEEENRRLEGEQDKSWATVAEAIGI